MGNPHPPIPLAPTPWHSQPLGELIDSLETSVNQGLTAEVAAQRLQHYGPNQLVAMPPRSPLLLLLDQFRTGPVALLGLAAAISFYINVRRWSPMRDWWRRMAWRWIRRP